MVLKFNYNDVFTTTFRENELPKLSRTEIRYIPLVNCEISNNLDFTAGLISRTLEPYIVYIEIFSMVLLLVIVTLPDAGLGYIFISFLRTSFMEVSADKSLTALT